MKWNLLQLMIVSIRAVKLHYNSCITHLVTSSLGMVLLVNRHEIAAQCGVPINHTITKTEVTYWINSLCLGGSFTCHCSYSHCSHLLSNAAVFSV